MIVIASEYRTLSDWQLAFLPERLEHKIASLRVPATREGAAMLQQYRERLDAVRAEQDRRRV